MDKIDRVLFGSTDIKIKTQFLYSGTLYSLPKKKKKKKKDIKRGREYRMRVTINAI
jgi:hypothetical protein